MIKIFKNRERVDEVTGAVTTPMIEVSGLTTDSVQYLFENIGKYVNNFDVDDRYNLHYTLCACKEGYGRSFLYQNVLVFDIDGMDITRKEEYIPIVCETIGVRREDITIICSGNGLHFVVFLDYVIDDIGFFEDNRVYFKAICKMIDYNLKRNELKGNADEQLFAPSRTLRLPETLNVKRGKPDTNAYFISKGFTPLPFDLRGIVRVVEVEVSDQIAPKALGHFKIASEAVMDGCAFLKHCKENQNDVNEAQWYAMLSIVGRLENGRDEAHSYSLDHDNYSEDETDAKLEYAVNGSGPRTCKNIDTLWDGCKDCPYYEKITSPILIKPDDYVRTEDTGFWFTKLDKDGNPMPDKPDYEGMLTKFTSAHPYVTMEDSKMIYIFNGSFWQPYPDSRVESFCYDLMNPKPMANVRREFLQRLQCTNLKAQSFFDTCADGINFVNGWLSLEDKILREHTIDKGFLYQLPYPYDPSAQCPRFDQFMKEITCDDIELEKNLLEFAGYCLSNTEPSWGEKCLLLYGDGANGKSVFMDVLKYVAGENNYTTLTMKDIENPTNRYSLFGKLFNVAEETPPSSLSDSTTFKALVTGGETMVKVLYRQPFSMKSNAKLLFACNKLPPSSDNTRGLFRRLIIAPFNAIFDGSRADKNLRKDLKLEVAGILNRFIEAYDRLIENKEFTYSKTVDNEMEAYISSTDLITSWFNEYIEEVEVEPSLQPKDMEEGQHYEYISVLYESYSGYCEAGNSRPQSAVEFARRLGRLRVGALERKVNPRSGRKETIKRGLLLLGKGGF